jgi:hypothetical protein
MTTVVNTVKDRSKYMSRTPEGTYEYGWVVYNRRDRKQDYFNKAGEGTYEEAIAWMDSLVYEPADHAVLAIGPSEKA